MAEQVKLFGVWASPFTRRIEIALKLKGVEYEFVEEDLVNKSDLLVKYNPIHKKVPVLLHNGNPICESVVIMEYIDETWKGAPILPRDPYERAMARFWAKFIDDKCVPAIWKACWSNDEEQENAIEEACELLKTLEAQLKGNKFFGGQTIGFVDIAANTIGFWLGILLEIVELELLTEEKFPKLCKWIDDYVNCSVIKENLPPRDKLLAYFRARQQPPTGSKD
ncbi:Glutathione S-transferase [Actinidia chinensis var. chinensis]|uniref:glutathione transferase n=1 Tax=Actinidia chinensis var. chinensis TaxID=1590841 RepID=A0A2R6RRK4_ACTCC|nr:Glutathione S-transferase [Actinidia chinensis var. chinensis]